MRKIAKRRLLAILTAALMVFAMMPMTAFADNEQYNINVTISPPNSGIVTGAGTYNAGDDVKLKAEPVSGYRFDHWKWTDQYGYETTDERAVFGEFSATRSIDFEAVFVEDPTNITKYEIVPPGTTTITPNDQTTGFTFRISTLVMMPKANGARPNRLKLKISNGTLVNQSDSSKTIPFTLCYYDTTTGTQNILYPQFEQPGSRTLYIIITASQWESAEPGVYTGSVTYQPYFQYNDRTEQWFETSSFPVELTIPNAAYNVSVSNGTVNGSASGDYAVGESVTITAGDPPAGQRFKEWTGAEGLTFTSGSATTSTATFTMPARAVELTATYEDLASIQDAAVVLSKTAFTYNGKVQKPQIRTIGGKTLTEGADYIVKWSNESSKNAGTYSLTITGKGNYVGTTKATYKINQAANPMTVKGKTATLKAKKLKKKDQTLAVSKVLAISNRQGAASYKLVSVSKSKFKKYFKVNAKTGAVTVKKKLKKGTYKVKISVTAAGNVNFKKSTKTVTATIKVN